MTAFILISSGAKDVGRAARLHLLPLVPTLLARPMDRATPKTALSLLSANRIPNVFRGDQRS